MKTKRTSWFIHIIDIFNLYPLILTKHLETFKKLVNILLHYLCFGKQPRKFGFDVSVMFEKIQMPIDTDKSHVFSGS